MAGESHPAPSGLYSPASLARGILFSLLDPVLHMILIAIGVAALFSLLGG